MARRDVTVVASGRRYRLGRTAGKGVIWRKRPWGWRVVARYPLTEGAWRVASAQFAIWEPEAEQPSGEPFTTSPTDNAAPTAPRRRRMPLGWVWILGVILLLGAAGGLFGSGIFNPPTSLISTTPHYSTTGTPRATTLKPAGSSTSQPSPPPTTSLPAVGNGYLTTGSTWVIYLQWADHNGALSGTVQEVTATGQPPTETVTTTTGPVSGTVTGNQISLSFNGGPEDFGTLTSGGFTINFRLKTGLLAPVHFREASTRQYNLAVANLHTEVAHANTAAATAQQAAALRTAVNKAATQVRSDIASLATAESSLSKDVAAVDSALQAEGAQLATEQKAEQGVLALPHHPTTTSVCTAADGVATDSNAVDTGANAVGTAVNTVTQDLTSGYFTGGLRQLMSTLSSAWSHYQTAQSTLPTYVPASAPIAATVHQALATATAAGTRAATKTNEYVNQANAEARSGVQYADLASRAGNCGSSQPTPALVRSLSWSSAG